jgi:hypothetical protein
MMGTAWAVVDAVPVNVGFLSFPGLLLELVARGEGQVVDTISERNEFLFDLVEELEDSMNCIGDVCGLRGL